MKAIHGHDGPQELSTSLLALLDGWIDLVHLFMRSERGLDAPYWYNERATLSVLAAAAWGRGGVALEEYSAKKRGHDQNADRFGRADLWVKLGGVELSFEAKQSWPTVAPGKAAAIARDRLREACRDVLCVRYAEAHRRAGIVFVVPNVAPRYTPSFDPAAFVQELSGAVDHDFRAWWFAEEANDWIVNEKGRRFPGVLLLGRFAGRARPVTKAA